MQNNQTCENETSERLDLKENANNENNKGENTQIKNQKTNNEANTQNLNSELNIKTLNILGQIGNIKTLKAYSEMNGSCFQKSKTIKFYEENDKQFFVAYQKKEESNTKGFMLLYEQDDKIFGSLGYQYSGGCYTKSYIEEGDGCLCSFNSIDIGVSNNVDTSKCKRIFSCCYNSNGKCECKNPFSSCCTCEGGCKCHNPFSGCCSKENIKSGVKSATNEGCCCRFIKYLPCFSNSTDQIYLDVRFLNSYEDALNFKGGLYCGTIYLSSGSYLDDQYYGYEKVGKKYKLQIPFGFCCFGNKNSDINIIENDNGQINIKGTIKINNDNTNYYYEITFPDDSTPVEKIMIISTFLQYEYFCNKTFDSLILSYNIYNSSGITNDYN